MTAIAAHEAYQNMAKVASSLNGLPKNKKSATSIVKAVTITTTEESLENSNLFLSQLISYQDALPTENGDADAKEMLSDFTLALSKVNGLLADVKGIFDDSDKEGSSVEIDNQHMLHFLANMERAQNVLNYIVEYLEYYLETQKEAQKPKVTTKVEDLISLITKAA